MKSRTYIILLMLALGTAWARGVGYQEGTIDLTHKVDLKMVFDGGLRPTQTPGLETTGCQVENVKVKIIYPENRTVTILVERGDFGVAVDQELTSMEFYGPFQPINDAIDQAETICKILSLDRGDLENIRANPGSYDHPNHSGWGGDIRTSETHVKFILRPRYHYKVKGADLSFTYTLYYGSKPPKFSTTPIQPPAGYEKFSMTPPKWRPTGPAYPPLSFEQVGTIAQCLLWTCGIVLSLGLIVGLWYFLRPRT